MINVVVCTSDCEVVEFVDCTNIREEGGILYFEYRGGKKVISGFRWWFTRINKFS